MPAGYTFPRKECPVCKQMISVVQFFRHEGSKTCAEVARLNAKQIQLIKK